MAFHRWSFVALFALHGSTSLRSVGGFQLQSSPTRCTGICRAKLSNFESYPIFASHDLDVDPFITPSRHEICGQTLRSSEIQKPTDDDPSTPKSRVSKGEDESSSMLRGGVEVQSWVNSIVRQLSRTGKPPPIQVEDNSLLLYDIMLILNLAVAISFWVVHRMHFEYIGAAFSEGCLMSLLWIGSGLYTGAFLYSAADGHHGSSNTKDGGPKGAGLLAAHTFVNAINLRLLFALLLAVAEHRPVGSSLGEQVMPLEIGFGFILMVSWRVLHSSFVPRL